MYVGVKCPTTSPARRKQTLRLNFKAWLNSSQQIQLKDNPSHGNHTLGLFNGKGGTPPADFPALLFVTLIFVIKYSRRWQPTIGGGKLAAPHLAN